MTRRVAASCSSQIQPTSRQLKFATNLYHTSYKFLREAILLVSQLFFSVVENECANSVNAVALVVEPVVTMVATSWGFDFDLCQLSDLGKGRLNSE